MISLRLENIVAFYRLYINSPCLESYSTFAMIALFSLGRLIELHNPTSISHHNKYLNRFCNIFLILVLSLNVLYYLACLMVLATYIARQLYKLANGTILSSSATLLYEEL